MAVTGLLADFLHFAGADAAGTDVHAHMRAVGSQGLDRLDIRFRDLLGLIVGVAHLVPFERALAADLTCSCHCSFLLDPEKDCLRRGRMLP